MFRTFARLTLAFALILTAACNQTKTSVVVDPALLVLVPRDTVLVAGIRIDKLRGTAFYKQYIEPNQPAELARFIEETGVDPAKQLNEILLCSNGKAKESVLLLRGKFSQAPLAVIGGDRPELRLIQKGWQEETVAGLAVATRDNIMAAFINGGVAVTGPRDAVTHLLENRGKNIGPSPDLQARIAAIPYRHQIWAATTGSLLQQLQLPDSRGGTINIGGLSEALQRSHGMQAGVDLSNGLFFDAHADLANPTDSKQIHDALRAVLGLARLQTPTDQPELLRLYNAVKVSQDSSALLLQANLSKDQLDQAAKLIGRYTNRANHGD